MNGHIMDRPWLTAWGKEIGAILKPFLASFETTYGYPPGHNRIIDGGVADGNHGSVKQLEAHPVVAPSLTTFYTTIDEVALPDIGNAYFIHPSSHMLDELTRDGPIHLAESTTAVVFGSDGGGILFAISPNGTTYRSRTASRDSDFEPIATDLRDFLEQLRQAVTRFITTGQPGQL
jgi:hypothetical protein